MISRAGHLLLTLFSMTILPCISLSAQPDQPNYNFKHLTVQDGLAQNIAFHFLQDNRGFVWIGTHNGLSVFDGTRTTNFFYREDDPQSVSGNFITALLEDSAGRIWIGNENGINRYNRTDRSFTLFTIDRPGGRKDTTYCVPLGFNRATDLWFLDTKTKSILSLNTSTGKTSFISNLNANNAVFYKSPYTGNTHIWSNYSEGTIHQVFKNSKLYAEQVYFSASNDGGQPLLEVNHVHQQNDSTVWLSTNKGLVKINPLLGKFQIFNKWKGQYISELRFARLSPKGQLWLASGPTGIFTFDTGTSQFIGNYRNDKSNPHSLCSDNIVSLYFDRMNNLWCGSYGSGVSYTNTTNIFFKKHLSKKDIQSWETDNKISSIEKVGLDNFWCLFANTGGICILDKNLNVLARKFPLLPDGKPFFDFTNKILSEDGYIWFATNKGLFNYDTMSNKLQPLRYPLLSRELMGSNWINDITRLKDGSVIFSTFAGLYRITRNGKQLVVNPFSSLNHEEFIGYRRIFQDEAGFIYVKSMGDAFYILGPNHAKTDYELVKKINFSPQVNHFFFDNTEKVTYLATTDGLYYIAKNLELEKKKLANVTNINSVFKANKKLWIFGEKGIHFFDENTGAARTFTTEDGLPANEFSASTLVVTADGKCVAGSANGLVSFYPDNNQHLIYPPGVQLRNIYINDRADSSTTNPDELKKLNLSYRQSTFSFDFAPISFQHAEECNFEYILEGYDEGWIRSGPARFTRYSKIPPGNYIFKVRAVDAAGKVSPFIKTMEVVVGRAFWQTAFFRILLLISLLATAWMVFRWYINQKISRQKREFDKQQAIERERTRIATDMHDDLGAGLSRIKFISQSISNKQSGDNTIKTELAKITGYSDEMSEKIGEIVWALNEKNDSLADLVAYTRSYAIEYLANHNITCKADTPLGLPGTFIAGEIRRNIFLSVKECLHNIVKHSGATCVHFSVALGRTMIVTIHDNGKGIDWDNTRAFSNGIQNIRQRMEGLKGEAEFFNEQGTKVVLTIPL